MTLRGITHVHSTHSYDGKVPLEILRERCLRAGLSFACMTEHTDDMDAERVRAAVEECLRLSDDCFVFVPGFEIPFELTHTLTIGADTVRLDLPPLEAIRLAREAGAWTVLAHPHRNGYELRGEHLAVLDAIEVWNSQYDGKYVPRTGALRLYRTLCKRRRDRLHASAGLDLHRLPHFGGPMLALEAERVDSAMIVGRLKAGNYVMERGGVKLDASATMTGSQKVFFTGVSALSVGAVGFFKSLSSGLAKLGIRPPKKIKELIRRAL